MSYQTLGITKTIISRGERDAYSLYKSHITDIYYKIQCEIERGFIYSHLVKSLVSNICKTDISIDDLIDTYKSHSNPDLLERASCLVNTFIPFSNFQNTASDWNLLFSDIEKANKNLKGEDLKNELRRINKNQDILYQKGFSNNYKDAKTFWGDLIMLGKGANGLIYESSNEELAKMFIIKYQISHRLTKKRNNMDIIHELHVNLVLNKYRNSIPNFMYGFGFFMCPPPLIEYKTSIIRDKEMDSICNIAGDNMFTIIERIDGPTFRDWISSKEYSLELFLNYYLQILFTLETAQDISYSHNDLHTSNIILKPVKKTVIKYEIDDMTYHVMADKIATIIDFGYSYIKTSRSFSVSGLVYSGVYYNKPNQLLDAYKLLMYSMLELIDSPKDLNELLPLFYYLINPENDPITWLKEEKKVRYSMPDVSRYTKIKYTHQKFIRYILKVYPSINFVNIDTNKVGLINPVVKDKKTSYTALNFFYLSRTRKLTSEQKIQFENEYLKLEVETYHHKILSKYFLSKINIFKESLSFYLKPVKEKGRLQFSKFTILRRNSVMLLNLASQLVNKRDILIYNYFKRGRDEKDKDLVYRINKMLFEAANNIWDGITILTSIYYKMLIQEDDNSVYVNYFKGKQQIILDSFGFRTREYSKAYKIKNQIEDYRDVFITLGRSRYISGMYPLDPRKLSTRK